MKEYQEIIYDKIMEFQRIGLNDFIYMKTEEQNWKESHVIQNTGTEDSKGKLIVDN
jgi:hypothetical protein